MDLNFSFIKQIQINFKSTLIINYSLEKALISPKLRLL